MDTLPERLSPFLNDEKPNNVGEDLGVHKGLDAHSQHPSVPERGGGEGEISYQEHFCPFLSHEALNTWVEDLGEWGGDDCLDAPFPKPPNSGIRMQREINITGNGPKFRNKDAERDILYWEWFCPFLDDVLDETGEDLGLHDGGCSIPNRPNSATRAGTLGSVTGKGSALSRMTKHPVTG